MEQQIAVTIPDWVLHEIADACQLHVEDVYDFLPRFIASYIEHEFTDELRQGGWLQAQFAAYARNEKRKLAWDRRFVMRS